MTQSIAAQRLCEKLADNAPLLFLILTSAGVGAFAATDNLYWRDAGYSLSEIGLTAALFNAGVVLAELPFAIYFDRYSNKKALMAGNMLRLAAFIIFFADGGFFWILLGQLMAGVGYAASSGTTEALLMNEVESSDSKIVTRNYAKVYFWSSFASLIAGSVGIGLYFFSPKYIWLLATALFAAAGVVIYFMQDAKANNAAIPWGEFSRGLLRTVRLPETYLIALVNSAAVAPFLFWQIKMGQSSLAVLFIGFLVMKGMGTLASRIVDKIEVRSSVIYGLIILNAGVITAFAYTESAALLPFVFGFHVLAHASLTIMAYGKFHARIENSVRASSGSVISLLDSLLVAVFAPVVGWLAENVSLTVAMFVSTVFYFTMLAYWILINMYRNTKGEDVVIRNSEE